DAFESGVDHPVDGVAATAPDADDLDHGEVVLRRTKHGNLPCLPAVASFACPSVRTLTALGDHLGSRSSRRSASPGNPARRSRTPARRPLSTSRRGLALCKPAVWVETVQD